MATTRLQLGQAAIGVGVAIIYTVPAGTKTIIIAIDVCNTAAALRSLRIFLVPNAGAPGTGNALFYDAPIPPHRTLTWRPSKGQILDTPGDTIQVQASAVGLTITASGVEET